MSPRRPAWPWLIGLAALVLAVYVLRSVLLPFIAGMAVAYFLDPIVGGLRRAGVSRAIGTSLVTATFFLILFGAFVLIVPLLQAQFIELLARVPGLLAGLREWLEPIVERVGAQLAATDANQLKAAAGSLATDAMSWTSTLLAGLWSGGMVLANLLSLLLITPVACFYLLRDWDRIVASVDSWLPRRHAEIIQGQLAEIDRVLAGFVRGQAVVCLTLAAIYGTALSVIGLEFGLVLGVLTGFLAFIPYVGFAFGAGIGLAVAFAQFDSWTPILAVAAVFVACQMFESNVLTPRLVGQRVGLHPVWIIFAVLAGGSLFGLVGVLIAVPVAAVVGVLARFVLGRYLTSPLYLGDNN